MSELRKTFNQSFDELRDAFAGFDSHSGRVVESIEFVRRVQDALYSYVLNAGPKPVLMFENAPHGAPESIQGHSEEQWPRVVQQQAEPAPNVHQLTSSEVPPMAHETTTDPNYWSPESRFEYGDPDRDEKLKSLADRIANVTQRQAG